MFFLLLFFFMYVFKTLTVSIKLVFLLLFFFASIDNFFPFPPSLFSLTLFGPYFVLFFSLTFRYKMRFPLLLLGGFIASAFAGHSHSSSKSHPRSLPKSDSKSDSSSGSHPASGGCNFTTADTAMQHKSSCSTIVLNNVKVPGGKTLDLTKLNDGTTVKPLSVYSRP